MKLIIRLLFLCIALLIAGCSTTKYHTIDPQKGAGMAQDFFRNESFVFLDLGPGPEGAIAIETFKSLAEVSPSTSAKRLSEQLQKNKRLAIYCSGNSVANIIVKHALKLCENSDLSEHQIFFITTPKQHEQIQVFVEKTGMKFKFKEYPNNNS
jgi:hypothetical protein